MIIDSAAADARFARRVLVTASAPILALIALIAVAAIVSRADFARREDQVYHAMTQRLVVSAVGARAQALEALAHDFATWTDGYDNVSRQWNPAWIANNYYSTAADAMIVIRSGQLRYLWTAESESRGAVGRDAVRAARNMIGASSQARGASASGMMLLGGDLAFVAIAPITPEEGPARVALLGGDRPLDYLLVVDTLGASDIKAMGEALGLGDLRFAAPPGALQGPASWSVSLANSERAGALMWRDEPPGGASLPRRIWVAILALLAVGLAAIWGAYVLTMRLVRDVAAKE